jgi:hypothetical protein
MLPKQLKPKQVNDLVRVGRNYDGGYLVPQSDIKKTETLISLGINDDWSFEENFQKINYVKIRAYDGTIGKRFWFNYITSSFFTKKSIFAVAKSINRYIEFTQFFTGNNKFIDKMVAFGLKSESLSNILKNEKSTYIKIDIEGSEYRLLPDLLSNQDKIVGCVIEFHNLDLHLDVVTKFVDQFSLNLVHLHVNTSCPKCAGGIPMVVECTFSRDIENKRTFTEVPHSLDMLSKPFDVPIDVSFEGD